MDDLFTRIWTDLVGRVSGPLTFRLILQPTMALIFAIRDGMKDARENRPPYFRTIFHDPAQRGLLLREGFKAVGRVFGLGIVMDVIYQLIVLRWVYPGEALLVALILAFLPYLLLRGPANRLARLWRRRDPAGAPETRAVPRDSKHV
jgi:hypothetical protein